MATYIHIWPYMDIYWHIYKYIYIYIYERLPERSVKAEQPNRTFTPNHCKKYGENALDLQKHCKKYGEKNTLLPNHYKNYGENEHNESTLPKSLQKLL